MNSFTFQKSLKYHAGVSLNYSGTYNVPPAKRFCSSILIPSEVILSSTRGYELHFVALFIGHTCGLVASLCSRTLTKCDRWPWERHWQKMWSHAMWTYIPYKAAFLFCRNKTIANKEREERKGGKDFNIRTLSRRDLRVHIHEVGQLDQDISRAQKKWPFGIWRQVGLLNRHLHGETSRRNVTVRLGVRYHSGAWVNSNWVLSSVNDCAYLKMVEYPCANRAYDI